MLTFTTFTSCSSAIRSSTGATAWHGPHHSAQKSTITLPSDFEDLLSKCRFGRVGCHWFLSQIGTYPGVNAGAGNVLVPGLPTIEACSRRFRTNPTIHALELEILELLGARGTFEQLRERNRGGADAGRSSTARSPRTSRARRPHRVGPDAEGRLPALQGAARLRPALPERLRLPGALDRGRGRARPRA